MPKIPFTEDGEKEGDEEAIPIKNIDPATCEKLGGTPTEEGFCLMRKIGVDDDGVHKYKPLKWTEKRSAGKKPSVPRE